MSNLFKNKSALFDRLHRYGVITILGFSLVASGVLIYNVYLFKKEGVPMIVNKYRNKIEEQIELKQREAEYLEHLKRSESEMVKKD